MGPSRGHSYSTPSLLTSVVSVVSDAKFISVLLLLLEPHGLIAIALYFGRTLPFAIPFAAPALITRSMFTEGR